MESTLTLKKQDFQVRVASNLGWGLGPDHGDPEWSTQKKFQLKDFVDSGYRQFLTTPPIQGFHPGAYKWSFLHPMATMTLAAGASTLLLPDDFGGAEGHLFISTAGSSGFTLRFGGAGHVYAAEQAMPTTTGMPTTAFIEAIKGTTILHGQKMQLRLWPIADQEYTLQFAYYLHPNALTDVSPYAYGAADHSETILESCLSVAELRLDDIANGPHKQQFMLLLAGSIRADQRKKPQYGGYNGDWSEGLEYGGRARGLGRIKYNGVLYD